jgi:putative transposase
MTVDHGTEFASQVLDEPAHQRGNGKLRDECLNVNQFLSIAVARSKNEAWRRNYNPSRPHGPLGNKSAAQYLAEL